MSQNSKILITGGAGFIGSNLCEYFLSKGHEVVCLDNFATGHRHNLTAFENNKNFTLIEGDIRNLADWPKSRTRRRLCVASSCFGFGATFHKRSGDDQRCQCFGLPEHAFGEPRRESKTFVYAASSSTYGDSEALPKVEDKIGKPLSPYAITKYVNELYADIFSSTYGLETIGLRYFNVFGRKQDPNGAYAAVIPKFVMQLMEHQSPVINGDGNFSRDFTYIDNVIMMNELAMTTQNPKAVNTVYNTAFGDRTTLNDLLKYLKEFLSEYDAAIAEVPVIHGPNRAGDIPHSLASIDKAKQLLGYDPQFSMQNGLKEAVAWYWKNLK